MRKKNIKKSSSRRKGAMNLAKDLFNPKPGFDIIKSVKRGDVVGALRKGASHVKTMGKHVMQAITGYDSNAKSWYVEYRDVTPAMNPNRPMGALFNTIITKNPTLGSTCKYMEILCKWEDFTNSFMWKQTITNSYQLLRIRLKSNLPYKEGRLSVYLNNSIQLAIALKQVERDIHWYNYSDPNYPDFAEMFSMRADVKGGYGVTELHQDTLLVNGVWSENLTSYERLIQTVATNVKLPYNLAAFIAHYFGTVFLDGDDGYNDQTIIMRMTNLNWQRIDESGNITTDNLDATTLTVDDLTKLVSELGTEFGMLIADLVNSDQYAPLYLDALDNYSYVMVYDRTFIQAIQNGYTDNSAVVDNYIRLDKWDGVEDELTQYIFSGGYAPREEGSLSNVPAITILAQVLKYNSNNQLKWPSGIDQLANGSNPTFTKDGPFGIKVSTSIESTTYVSTRVDSKSLALPLNPEDPIPLLQNDRFVVGLSVDAFSLPEDIAINQVDLNPETGPGFVYYCIPLLTLSGKQSDNTNKWNPKTYIKLKVNRTLPNLWPGIIERSVITIPYEVIAQINNRDGYNNQDIILPTGKGTSVWGKPFILKGAAVRAFDSQINLASKAKASIGLGTYTTTISESFINAIQLDWTLLRTQLPENNYYYYVIGMHAERVGQVEVNITVSVTQASNVVKEMTAYVNEDFTSEISLTQAVAYLASIGATTYSDIVTGYTQLAGLAAKETHAGLPIVVTNKVYGAYYPEEGEPTINSYTTDPVLLKHEHIPYYYNIVDLQAVLYTMFVSLFTPSKNIYQLLLTRKAEITAQRKKGKKDKSKEGAINDKKDLS